MPPRTILRLCFIVVALRATFYIVGLEKGSVQTFDTNSLAQGLQEARAICVLLENGCVPFRAVHHVVNRPGILHSEFSRHAPSRHLCQCLGLTPSQEGPNCCASYSL